LLATAALLKKAPFRIRSPIAGHLTITNRKVAEVADCAVRDRRKGSRQHCSSCSARFESIEQIPVGAMTSDDIFLSAVAA
jgi:hypothetical protein